MRWRGRRESNNFEDRRFGGKTWLFGGMGLGGVLLLIWMLFENPSGLIELVAVNQAVQDATEYVPTEEEDSLSHFVRVVLADTEDVWTKLLQERGMTYRKPTLVLYHNLTPSGCGYASQMTGPFYCPSDEKIYLDIGFYKQMREEHHVSGDFAFAYVLAHEVGHHVQKLLGILDKENALRVNASEKKSNAISVQIELQADFLAGVWVHHSQKMFNDLNAGDVEEAINTAAAIGDDRLQKQSQGYVVPDSFTHGASEQRQHWFMKGYQTGNLSEGDTFSAEEL